MGTIMVGVIGVIVTFDYGQPIFANVLVYIERSEDIESTEYLHPQIK